MLTKVLNVSLVAAVFVVPALAQSHGAVFTTNPTGHCVEGNLYPRKRDVLLTGGASPLTPCFTSGLADGEYYFQVTDASGALLLSMDAVTERWVRVAGGLVTDYLGSTHPIRHNGPCGSTVVRLMPYLDTPLPGAEYKVWMTAVGDYDPNGSGSFGFSTSRSVTDNFVIGGPLLSVPVSIIKGFAFFDHNENGAWDPLVDPLEIPLPGWRVELLLNGQVDGVTYTDMNGRYTFIRDRDSTTYQVREQAPGGFVGSDIVGAEWVAHTPQEADVIADEELPPSPDFGSVSVVVYPLVGRSKQWWGTSDGHYFTQLRDPVWRDTLTTYSGRPVSLRRPISNDDPAISIYKPFPLPESYEQVYTGYVNYLSQPANDHAGFLLSREVATALLNNSCGFMQFTAYIDRHNDGILVPFDTMVQGVLDLLNHVGAGLTGPNDPYQDLRNMMLMCTNEFGSINNTGDPSAPQIIRGRSDSPNFFVSPY